MPDQFFVAAAIVRRGDEILMVLQAGPGEEPVWSIPGGQIEPGEFVVDALVREVREETGIEVVDPGRISWQPVTVRYLRGELDEPELWLRRVHEDGREEWL